MSIELKPTRGWVTCPKKGKRQHARNCKLCEHCRIYLGDVVKCSYNADNYKEEHPMVHPIYL